MPVGSSRESAISIARQSAGFSPTELDPRSIKIFHPETGEVIGEVSNNGRRYWKVEPGHVEWWNHDAPGEKGSAVFAEPTTKRSGVISIQASKSGTPPNNPPARKEESATRTGRESKLGESENSTKSGSGGANSPEGSSNLPNSSTRFDTKSSNAERVPSNRVPKVHDVHPRLPVRKHRKDPTHGIFNDKIPLMSGKHGGRAFEVFGPGIRKLSRYAKVALKHVEGHAAAEMVADNLKEGVLHINHKRGPCKHCIKGIPKLLNEDQKLWVVFHNGAGYFTNKGWFRK